MRSGRRWRLHAVLGSALLCVMVVGASAGRSRAVPCRQRKCPGPDIRWPGRSPSAGRRRRLPWPCGGHAGRRCSFSPFFSPRFWAGGHRSIRPTTATGSRTWRARPMPTSTAGASLSMTSAISITAARPTSPLPTTTGPSTWRSSNRWTLVAVYWMGPAMAHAILASVSPAASTRRYRSRRARKGTGLLDGQGLLQAVRALLRRRRRARRRSPAHQLPQGSARGRLHLSPAGRHRKRPPAVPRIHAAPQHIEGAPRVLQHPARQLHDRHLDEYADQPRAPAGFLEDSGERLRAGISVYESGRLARGVSFDGCSASGMSMRARRPRIRRQTFRGGFVPASRACRPTPFLPEKSAAESRRRLRGLPRMLKELRHTGLARAALFLVAALAAGAVVNPAQACRPGRKRRAGSRGRKSGWYWPAAAPRARRTSGC